MRNLKTAFIASATTMLLAVSGQSLAGSGEIKHGMADLNGDGMVTTDELLTYVELNFMKMDKNNDHMLDAKEWEDIFDRDHS